MKKSIVCALFFLSFSYAQATECDSEQLKQFHSFWDSISKEIELIVNNVDSNHSICETMSYEDTLLTDVNPIGKSKDLSKKYCAECIDFCKSNSEEAEKILIKNNYLECNFYVSISIYRESCTTYFGL